MTVVELKRHLAGYLRLSRDSSELMDLLGQYQAIFSIVPQAGAKILESSKAEDYQAEAGKMRSALISSVRDVRSISAREVFETLRDLDAVLSQLAGEVRGLRPFQEAILKALRTFSDRYDEFLQDYQRLPTLEMLQAADDLKRRIEVSSVVIDGILDELSQWKAVPEEGWDGLTVILYSAFDLDQLSRKLAALAVLYKECCTLLGISTSEYPARVSRVETGSLFAEIVGNSSAVNLLSHLLRAASDFFVGRFTRQGKIEALPRKVAAVDSILDISNRLKKQGVDTKNIEEQLEKSTFKIAQELNQLLVGEPRVEIDGNLIEVGSGLEQKYLHASEMKALGPARQSASVAEDFEDGAS